MFRFRTEAKAPDLPPYVLATVPSDGERDVFTDDPIRVVLAHQGVRKLADLTAPKVGAGTGLHRYNTTRLPTEELEHLSPAQPLAEHRPAKGICAVELKHMLCEIKPDHANFADRCLPLWIKTNPPWHEETVGGVYSIRAWRIQVRWHPRHNEAQAGAPSGVGTAYLKLPSDIPGKKASWML